MIKNTDVQARLEAKLLRQELKEDPYRQFRIAFSLMSVIPLLVFLYLLLTRLFSFKILSSDVGLTIFIASVISICGFLVGYNSITKILDKIIIYALQAKRNDQLKSTFVATVSHELKSPLAVMKLNLSNIRDGLVGQVSPEQKKILELCNQVAERMVAFINYLLDLHKAEAGKIELQRKLCDLIFILDNQLKVFEILFASKQIRLNRQIQEANLSLWADEERMSIIVNNLLSNAIKYTPAGGDLTLKAFYSNGHIRLEFIDSGPGIPEDKKEQIFDKFQRLQLDKEGTGLGLSITKDIVELHRGKIWVESELGKGSKFVVVLPRDLRQEIREGG